MLNIALQSQVTGLVCKVGGGCSYLTSGRVWKLHTLPAYPTLPGVTYRMSQVIPKCICWKISTLLMHNLQTAVNGNN